MSAEENKALFRRLVDEFINTGNEAVADEVMTPDFVEHEELGGPPTREGVKQFFAMFRAAFPDLRVTIEDMIAEGDKVVARLTMRGTHQGEFLGIPPTGKQVTMGVIDIVRVADGKAVEHWGISDQLGLMQQLGAIPAPGQ